MDTNTLAKERHNNTGIPLNVWLDVVARGWEALKQSGYEPAQVAALLKGCESPGQFLTLSASLDLFARELGSSERAFTSFASSVNESPYAMEDWVEGICAFYEWLDRHNRRVRFSLMLGYMDCCAESSENSVQPVAFGELVTTMLDEFGFEN